MHTRKWGLLGLIVLYAYVSLQKQDTPNVAEHEKAKVPRGILQAEEIRPEELPKVRPTTFTEKELTNLRKSFPDKLQVKSEAGAHPHQTPDSLIKFAKALGPLVEKAKQNPPEARQLLDEMGNCASDENVFVSARALCVSKAEQLTKAFPELENKLNEIHQNADRKVIELNRKQKAFLK
jgi:hypothetical protein